MTEPIKTDTAEQANKSIDEVTLTEEEKTDFFKCFLADTPYSETVTLFNGKIKVVFRTLTIEENDDLFRQIDMDVKADKSRKDDSYLGTIAQYRLGLSLVSINGTPFCPEITKEDVEENKEEALTYVSARAATIKKWSVQKVVAITDAYSSFEKKVIKLTENALTEDFWPADL